MDSNLHVSELMLHVLTARGVLSWTAWREAYDSVAGNAVETGLPPYNLAARQLDQLGHIEIVSMGGEFKLAAAPAVFVRLPRLGLPTAVLCGGRSPQTERKLRDAAAANSARLMVFESRLERQMSPRSFFVEGEDVSHLARTAAAAGVQFAEVHAAWSMVNAAGNIDSYAQSLTWRHEPEANLQVSEFSLTSLRFGPPQTGAQGRRLLRYFPRRLPSYYELRDGDRAARTDRDWGMYATLGAHGQNCLIHDSRAKIIAVPAGVPLPKLIARALALCSGLSPAWLPSTNASWPSQESNGFYIYTAVPDSIAETVFEKMGQFPLPLHIPTEFLKTLHYSRPYE
jgi:hypothetical protein